MKITYAIAVCNESRDLYSLLSFLRNVKDDEDDINVLIDTAHVTDSVRSVLSHFESCVTTCERSFDGDFSKHRNFHLTQCTGDYIFILDPDEMPQEDLIIAVKRVLSTETVDMISVPRVNITLGATKKWYEEHDFGDKINEMGWVNWPDYQGRVVKNTPDIRFGNELHERLQGYQNHLAIKPHPTLALLHVKSVDKDNNRWENGKYISPKNDNLYDKLM